MSTSNVGAAQNGGWLFFSNGTAAVDFVAPSAGTYRISVRAYQQAAGPDPALLSIEVAGMPPALLPVTALAAAPATYTLDVMLGAGNQQLAVGFANDFYDEATSADRNLWIDHVEVAGPYGGPVIDEARRGAILVCPSSTTRAARARS